MPCALTKSTVVTEGLSVSHGKMAEQPFSVEKVHEGVYMLREKFYDSPNRANIWLVQGSTTDLVIDTGLGIWDLPSFLQQQGLIGEKPLQAVALTSISITPEACISLKSSAFTASRPTPFVEGTTTKQ